MLYSEKKERERRFLLALRMGLPVFLLVFALLYFNYFLKIPSSFFDQFVIIVLISIYFIFYLIYIGFDEKLTDPVSKAFERKTILKILKKNIDKKEDFSVLFFAIDNLDDINERYGVTRGDFVLEGFVRCIDVFFLQKGFKDLPIGRYKGGEFITGLALKKEQAQELVRDFLDFCTDYKIDDIEIKASGVIVHSDFSKNVDEIMTRLYELYYQIVRIPNKNIAVAAKREFDPSEFERFIIDTIQKKAISLRFQPSLNIKTNNYDLMEVLVKLDSLEHGLIHSSQFIPVVNRLGYEKIFDRILIEKVLEFIGQIRIDNICYSLNISPFSIRNESFFDEIKKLYRHYGVHPSQTMFELAENKVYKDLDRYKMVIEAYRKEGFCIALDNFGAFNASFEYTKHIPIDMVHFDVDYTKNMDKKEYEVFFASLVEACQRLNIKTLFKFVDSERLLKIAKKTGVDYVQGYLISKPLNAEEVADFLSKG